MEADWDEVTRVGLPPPGVHALPTAASTMAFDVNHELLWVGNDYGRVTSFYGPELQKYTSFRAHPSSEGPVKQLLFNDKGIISVASRSIHMASRRGLAEWHLSHEHMKDLRCMSYTSKGTTEILAAGCQNTMFIIDASKGIVLHEVHTDDNYTIMKRSHYICSATDSGSVNMLDPVTFKVIKTWKAHSAWINDMDARNNFLVTCGYSPRQQQTLMLDPLANVFDLKTMAPLPPIPFHAGAAFVRMHPRMSTTSLVASQSGQLQVVDLMNPNTVNLRQVNTASYLTALELAPSGEGLCVADGDCFLHLWGSPSKIHFAELSNPTEFADIPPPAPSIPWGSDQPLNTVGLPYYRDQLLSAWPSHLIFEVGAPPIKIDPDILTSLTVTEFGSFAPNPKKKRRNEFEDTRQLEKASAPLMAPKFLSEKARQTKGDDTGNSTIGELTDSLDDSSLIDVNRADVPVMYRNVEIKYSKFGVDDFDFEYYNKTKYSGLETHITNSYANPLLQLYKFTPFLRNLALHHTATACLTETCLLCEMGFLFDMLDRANGQNCQATNFLKTFSSLPPAAAMGLLEESAPNTSLTTMIQSMNRFLLDWISKDFKQLSHQSSQLDQVLATAAVSSIRCVHCNTETVRPGGTYVNELVYPPKGRNQLRHPEPTFSQILKASVERENQTRGWCDKCRRYQQLTTRKTIQSVPLVFMINTAISSPEARRLWSIPGWLPNEIGIIVENGQFFCYEGEDLKLHMQRGYHYIMVYELIGIVADVNSSEQQKSHLVSLVNVGISSENPEYEDQWHLFNDFLVRKISKEEAFRFVPSWKLPSVLAYQIKTGKPVIDDSWKEKLDTSLLYHDWSLNRLEPIMVHKPLSQQTETPHIGMLVAIDAEFVALQQEEIEIKADGSRETIRPSRLGLARVSVLRGEGTDEGVPFIDDYIATNEPIVDYLTAFSGIKPGDLDPKLSNHNLVPLKVAYKKLWLLLNLGCVFIGHGLPKDFRTINIHVPKTQVIDTVDLFFIKARQRKLSLRFLAWFLLKEDIQTDTHDSIEDARTALKLYRKYQEFDDAGVFETILNDVYSRGRDFNYKVPSALKVDDTVGGRDTPPILLDAASAPSTPARRPATTGSQFTNGSSDSPFR